jgi:hypothetical protein
VRLSSDLMVNQHRWITNDSDCIISSLHSWIPVILTDKNLTVKSMLTA